MVASFAVVVVKSGRINSTKVLSTTFECESLVIRLSSFGTDMWTYMFMDLTSHLSSKAPEIHSVSGADRTNPKLFLSLVRYKILSQLFGMLVDTI